MMLPQLSLALAIRDAISCLTSQIVIKLPRNLKPIAIKGKWSHRILPLRRSALHLRSEMHRPSLNISTAKRSNAYGHCHSARRHYHHVPWKVFNSTSAKPDKAFCRKLWHIQKKLGYRAAVLHSIEDDDECQKMAAGTGRILPEACWCYSGERHTTQNSTNIV